MGSIVTANVPLRLLMLSVGIRNLAFPANTTHISGNILGMVKGGCLMPEIEKVKIGLKCLSGDVVPCSKCPYHAFIYSVCKVKCAQDALELLEQDERLDDDLK